MRYSLRPSVASWPRPAPTYNARAAEAAVGLLMRWLDQQGLKLLSLEGMVVPELRPVFSGDPVLDPEPGAITEQILVAEAVCDQFLFMQTADTTMELESDRRGLRAKLDAWLALGH